jgi:peroxin-5
VKHEQNPKFQKSQFMNLMKQLRDGEVIVDGNQVVQSDGTRTSASASTLDVKGKGRAIDPTVSTHTSGLQNAPSEFAAHGGGYIAQHHQQQGQGHEQNSVSESKDQDMAQQQEREDPNDAYFRQENAEYMKYWGEGRQDTTGTSAEAAMWDRLQEDWDNFEAISSGIKPVTRYVFQENNPYLLGESSSTSSRTRHHMQHSSGHQRQTMLEVRSFVRVFLVFLIHFLCAI